MAKFLQETISETGFRGTTDGMAAQEFAEFFRKVSCGLGRLYMHSY